MIPKLCPECSSELRVDDVAYGICWRCGKLFEGPGDQVSTGKDNVRIIERRAG